MTLVYVTRTQGSEHAVSSDADLAATLRRPCRESPGGPWLAQRVLGNREPSERRNAPRRALRTATARPVSPCIRVCWPAVAAENAGVVRWVVFLRLVDWAHDALVHGACSFFFFFFFLFIPFCFFLFLSFPFFPFYGLCHRPNTPWACCCRPGLRRAAAGRQEERKGLPGRASITAVARPRAAGRDGRNCDGARRSNTTCTS